jgi:uncharacterized peroxidase-related enzyme
MHLILVSIYFLINVSIVHSMYLGLPDTDIGIGGLLRYSPKTGHILLSLAEELLRESSDGSSLSPSDRELIAVYVSYLNECHFCCNSHSAVAVCLLNNDKSLIEMIKNDPLSAPISEKLKSLLTIAAAVQKGGKKVTQEMITHACLSGVTDREIHDTVLIASAFCMFNRYVDGLAAWTPTDNHIIYQEIGEAIVTYGYVRALAMLRFSKK